MECQREEKMPGKYYAVKKGRKPGVYQSWAECKAMVDGFPGAVYKSFKTREEAVAFQDDGRGPGLRCLLPLR